MATPNMNLILPVVTVTLGPEWANEVNAAFESIDSHDHTSGKGVPITPSAIDINANLDFQYFKAYNLKTTQYQDQTATLTGALNASSVYSKAGDLWYTNGSGIAVQLTAGSSIITVPSSADNFQFDAINTSLTIGPSDNYVIIDLDTSVSRTVTLPPASAVTPGRIYFVHDATGSSEINPVTINPDGTDTIDLAPSDTLNSDFGTKFYASNGVNKWSAL